MEHFSYSFSVLHGGGGERKIRNGETNIVKSIHQLLCSITGFGKAIYFLMFPCKDLKIMPDWSEFFLSTEFFLVD
jgi:hypothetical protein